MIQAIAGIFNINSSTSRSKAVVKNAVISLLLKGLSILLSFVFVPLYLGAVGQRQYGIILTITSVSYFISFFDVGIGNGLRSKLGKAIANEDKHLGRQYVSTAYFYVTLLFISFFLVYCFISPFVKWYKILNISVNEIPNLNSLVFIVIAIFSARFVFQLIGTIFMADQRSSLNDSISFTTSVLVVIVCYTLKALHSLSFYSLLITMVSLPLLVLIIYTFISFVTRYKWLRPSLSFVDHDIRKDLLNLGFKFFLIQMVALTIFSTTNILIAQLFDIGEVTRYNIAYKYYNITVMVYSILMSPLWGAFTNAWYKGETKWIIKNFKYYLGIILFFVFINIAQYFIYPYFIHFWLKREMAVPEILAISFILYNIVFCYNDIFAHFLASVGKIDRQVFAAVAGGIINIPITIYLAKYTQLGLSAILFANILCLLPSSVVTTIQTIQLLRPKNAVNNT